MKTFIIAEVGVNHNGSVERALDLVDITADIGADAIKFQTFEAAKLATRGAGKAEYQTRQTGGGDQLDMLAALQLSHDDHLRLVDRCEKRGIEFMSTPFDIESAHALAAMGMKRLKLPSGDIDFVPMIRTFARLQRPVIMSTGMATLEEVRFAKTVLEEEWSRIGAVPAQEDRLTILHCTSNYPAQPVDVNLRAMVTMQNEFGCPVGYSDHTDDIYVAVGAVALGATVIEKHITQSRALPGPDHAASLEPERFAQMIAQIRSIEQALGDGDKAPRQSEMAVRNVVRRSIVAANDIPVGEAIGPESLMMLRPANGISPREFDRVVGRIAARPILAGALIGWDDLR